MFIMKRTLLILIITCGALLSARAQDLPMTTAPADTTTAEMMSAASWPIDSALRTNHFDWLSYQMKVSMTTGDQDLAFQCFFINRTDSLMYFNLNRSGIELARVVLTPDSVVYVNKLDKTYYRGDFSIFMRIFGFPLTFNWVQSLMNARDLADFTGPCTSTEEAGQLHYFWPQRSAGDTAIMQEIQLGEGGILLQNDITDLKSMRSVSVKYNDYVIDTTSVSTAAGTDTLSFFTHLTIDINSEDTRIDATLKSFKVNTPRPTNIKIPDSFTPAWSNTLEGKKP